MLAGGLRLPRGKAWVDGCKRGTGKGGIGGGADVCMCVFTALVVCCFYTFDFHC